MRIDSLNAVQQIYSPKKAVQAQAAPKAYNKDSVEFSSIGKDILVAKSAVDKVPDIRAEIVDPVKEAVKNGSYEVSVDDFADKLLSDI